MSAMKALFQLKALFPLKALHPLKASFPLCVTLLLTACSPTGSGESLRDIAREKSARYADSASNEAFLRDVEDVYARYALPPGGMSLPESVGVAIEGFVGRVLDDASAAGTEGGDSEIRQVDIAAALESALPSEPSPQDELTFFPRLAEPDRVAISASDVESFRAHGMAWRLLDVMLDGEDPSQTHPDPLHHHRSRTLDIEPAAADLLAEAVSRYAVLLLRIAGQRAGVDETTSFFDRRQVVAAAAEIRRRASAHSPAVEVEVAPGGPGISSRDRRYYAVWGIDPDDAELHYRYGSALVREGHAELARPAFERTLLLAPGHVPANFGLGEISLLENDGEAALAHFEAVLAGEPGQFTASAHTRVGRILGRAGRGDEALAHFQQSVALNSDQPEARFNLGISLKRHDRLEEAAVQFAKAVELDPDFTPARRQLGQMLARLERWEEAIPHYEYLIEANREDPVALYELAEAVEALGDSTSARQIFEQSLIVARRHPRYSKMALDLEKKLTGNAPEAEVRPGAANR